MRILFEHGETVSIRGNQSLNSYPFSVSYILNYANSRGYNSVFFDPYYQDTSSAGWLMRFINLELIDGNLYLCDYNPNEWYRWAGGYSSLSSPYINHFMCANSATELGDQISPSTGFGDTTYLGRSYKYYSVEPKTTEPMFATSLQYTKIFVNNEDVTPVTYNWKSVRSLSLATAEDFGLPSDNPNLPPLNNSTMLLSYIPDESLNNGEPVSGGTDFVIKNPSLPDYVTEYNDTSMTYRTFFLKSKKFCKIGRQISGLVGENYTITLKSADGNFTYFETTISTGLGTGVPYLGFIIDRENTSAQLNIIFVRTQYDSATGLDTRVVDFNTITHSDSDRHSIYAWLSSDAGDDDYSDDDRENENHGGDESDPVTNEPLNRLDLPTKGAVGSGFVKLYDISDEHLQDLCEFMWDDSLLTNLGRLFNDPREIIVGIMVFPFKPTHVTTGVNVYAGNLDTGITADLLTQEYETIAAGSCRVPVGDADFMSFAPYRKIRIFIPYCGEHELDPSAVYGSTLRLYYHISFFSGNVIAEVTRTFEGGSEEPMWFFQGQVGFQVPISGEDFTRTISTLLQAGVGAAVNYVMGNVGGIVKSSGQLVSGNLAPSVQYSQAAGANSAFLSCQQPHLIFSCPIKAYDGDQDEYIGNTYHKTKTLDDCSGFTKCFEAHLEGLDATNNELQTIENFLTSGVIIKHDGSSTPSGTPSQPGNIVIHFMHCESERNVIGKTWDTPNAIEGKLFYDQSISTPIVTIDGNLIGYNYAYIDLFKRFYWIKDIKAVKNSMTEVHLEVDPLQSFDEDIKNCKASVDRQATDNNNAFVEDPYKWTQVNHDVAIRTFKSTGLPVDFDHITDTYILTIAGT